MSEKTKELTVPDAKQELVKAKAKKPTKKQAVMAGLLRYEMNTKRKLAAIEKTNHKKIKTIDDNIEKVENNIRDEVMTIVFKHFGNSNTANRDDIYITYGRYGKISLSFETGNNFDVSISDEQWPDNKKLQKLLIKGDVLEDEKTAHELEINSVRCLLNRSNMIYIKKKLTESMSVGERLSDMEIAVAIVKENSNNIDKMLSEL